MRFSFALVIALVMGGCAIHPLPDDVTGYDTYQIVAKIRCEAQDAVRAKAIRLLAQLPRTQALAETLRADPLQFNNLEKMPLDPIAAFFIRKYWDAAIAYEFTFDMTENNVIGGAFTFLEVFRRATFRSGLGLTGDHSRQNIRHFQITDTFGRLLTAEIFCPRDRQGPNYFYPISGHINIAEPINQFIDLNEFQNLTGLGDKVPTLAENLSFQTIVSGSATPQITLTPATSGISDASLTLSAKRIDIHRLNLGFSLPIASNQPAPFPTTVPIVPGGPLVTLSAGRTPAENRALAAIERAKINQFLVQGNVTVLPVQR